MSASVVVAAGCVLIALEWSLKMQRVTPEEIRQLERRIAIAQTTAADVDLLRLIIAQVNADVCAECLQEIRQPVVKN